MRWRRTPVRFCLASQSLAAQTDQQSSQTYQRQRTRLGHRVCQEPNRVTVRISVEPDKLPVIVDSVDGRSAIRQYCVRIVNRGICARRDGIHKSVVEAIAVLIYTYHLTNIVHAQEHRIGRTRKSTRLNSSHLV